jgi:DNA repair protein RecN (Recombination protein N)
MLRQLHIRDFAIIDELDLELGQGFVVLTGETGAGKSILVDAVELILGGRAEATYIRSEAPAALIEAVFEVAHEHQATLQARLEPEGLADDPRQVTLAREIRREGRNISRINGRAVSLNLLREIGEQLVDVHGQSEHLSLLRVREHLDLLDRFARNEGLRAEFAAGYGLLSDVRGKLMELRQAERDAARRAEYLAFQIREIESAQIKPGEEKLLAEERTRLANAEQLAVLAEQAAASLDEADDDRPAAVDRLGEAGGALQALARVDGSLQDTSAEVQSLLEQAADLAKRLRTYRESIEFNPRRLDEVEERLGLLRGLMRKYGDNPESVLAHAESARRELEAITHAEERITELTAQEEQLLHALGTAGQALSQARDRAGRQLAEAIEIELTDLRMAGARFGVELQQQEDPQGVYVGGKQYAFHAHGIDRLEFLVAPNPGEGLKPLVKIASGGETSRLMLGLKSVLARADRTPTLIFDEIDQGIGGRVGAVVGHKLWRLARQHQVLCVTHLPQLAAFGDQHFRVEKVQRAGRTYATIGPLSVEERLEELAQMLGGPGEANERSAAELLAQAENDRRQAPRRA